MNNENKSHVPCSKLPEGQKAEVTTQGKLPDLIKCDGKLVTNQCIKNLQEQCIYRNIEQTY